MAKGRKSPQEKKQFEYTYDHFTFAEHVHAFRKQWPRKKARINREYRRKTKELLTPAKAGMSTDNVELVAGDVTAAQIKKSFTGQRLRKSGTVTVGEKIKLKLQKRAEKVNSKATSRKKNEDLVAYCLNTLNSLDGGELADAARRAYQLNRSHDHGERFRLGKSQDPVDRALQVFSEICSDGRYLCGNGHLIDSIRRSPQLRTEFWRWVEKYEHIITKDLRKTRRKLTENATAKRKMNSIRR